MSYINCDIVLWNRYTGGIAIQINAVNQFREGVKETTLAILKPKPSHKSGSSVDILWRIYHREICDKQREVSA